MGLIAIWTKPLAAGATACSRNGLHLPSFITIQPSNRRNKGSPNERTLAAFSPGSYRKGIDSRRRMG
jgi:hypothetical protein